VRTLMPRNPTELEHASHHFSGLEGSTELQAPDRRKPEPDPWLPPGLRCQPGLGHEKVRPEL
jgi:hypothetical protein